MKVIKRNKDIIDFTESRIDNALKKAFNQLDVEYNDNILNLVLDEIKKTNYSEISVEEIQDIVVKTLMLNGYQNVGVAYQSYRMIREKERKHFDDLIKISNEIYKNGSDDNSNKPSNLRNVKRDMIAGEIEKIQAQSHIPKKIWNAHIKKDIHWHDMDFSGIIPVTNCCIPDVWDMLENGTKINNAGIEKPKSILVANTILTQIIANIAHQQYGGISISDFNEGLAQYATMTLNKNFRYNCSYENLEFFKVTGDTKNIPKSHLKAYETAKEKTKKDIYDACQTFEYQVNSLSSASQTPFVTIMFNIPTSWESEQIILSYFKVRMNGLGKKKKIAVFPKINYVVVDGLNLYPNDKYYYITEKALECTSKCYYPDYLNYSYNEYKNGKIYSRMG